jgi:hypothetical protein
MLRIFRLLECLGVNWSGIRKSLVAIIPFLVLSMWCSISCLCKPSLAIILLYSKVSAFLKDHAVSSRRLLLKAHRSPSINLLHRTSSFWRAKTRKVRLDKRSSTIIYTASMLSFKRINKKTKKEEGKIWLSDGPIARRWAR